MSKDKPAAEPAAKPEPAKKVEVTADDRLAARNLLMKHCGVSSAEIGQRLGDIPAVDVREICDLQSDSQAGPKITVIWGNFLAAAGKRIAKEAASAMKS